MRPAVGIVLLLLVAGLALPVHSQDEAQTESVRWPYFETESLISPPNDSVRRFGHDIATDGERILVAASNAAYLYTREQNHWTLEATLNPGFGSITSVSLADSHAIVAHHGEVAIWNHDGTGWKRQTSLTSTGAFGDDVLAKDSYLFVSQPLDDFLINAGSRGAVHIYKLSGNTYAHHHTIEEPTTTNQRIFGADLAMRDGILVVGAPAQPFVEQAAPGAAYIYTRQGSTWNLADSVEASRGTDAESSFGFKVATTGTAVVVSASTSYLAASGDKEGSGWVSIYEKSTNGRWQQIQDESTDATAVAAREDTILIVNYWWSNVGVYIHENEKLRCWWGPWCEVGFLGGWAAFGHDHPHPEALALEGRVAALGAPSEYTGNARTGLVLAYYDNANPIAIGLPDEPVDDIDQDGHEAFTLDASHSFDRDGTIVDYEWRRDGKTISNEPFVDVDLPLGNYDYELTVTDDLGGTGTQRLNIVVRPPQLGLTIQYCCEYYRGIDPDRFVYFWSDVDDHRAGAKHWDWDWDGDGTTDSTEANPTHRFPHGGTWPVHLTVTNEAGDTLHAYQDITINNAPPVANAGPPRVVQVDAAGLGTAKLDGSASTDPDSAIQSYNWLRQDPVAGTYSTAASGEQAEAQITRGVNQFRLRVSDDHGATHEARLTIIGSTSAASAQNSTVGTIPADFTAKVLPKRSVTFTDTSTPGGSDIVAWSWGTTLDNMTQGPRSHTITFDDAGPQPFYLTVYDERGNTGTAMRTVTIPDDPPRLSAWPLAGTVPQGSHGVFLARAADEAPDRLQWEWRINGKHYSDHQNAGHTFDKLGNHTIDIRVTDDMGHTDALSGWINVLPEDEFQDLFGPPDDQNDTSGPGIFQGDLAPPDESIQEDLDRQRALDKGDKPDAPSTDKNPEAAPLLSATAPKTPSAGGIAVMPLVWTGILLLFLALGAIETRRRLAHRKRRRQRYESAMKARLMRHEPAVEFRTGRR